MLAHSLHKVNTTKLKSLVVSILLMVALLALVGCNTPFGAPTTISQTSGLPTLHHLNWGASYYEHALYSPDGRWIAVLAGSDFSKSHLEVLSPDGHTQYDLSNWNCGLWEFFDYAWLPDGRLSCIRADSTDGVYMLCVGSYPFHTCDRKALSSDLRGEAKGAVWTTDGAFLLLAAYAEANGKVDIRLCVTKPDGAVTQVLLLGNSVSLPQWRPHTTTLSYLLGNDLVLSSTSWAKSQLTLGKPQIIVGGQEADVSRYAWSPSGHWIAARVWSPGDDKIALINADNPAQTVNVVSYSTAQWLTADPVWSPDGKTLIVFTVSEDQPYAINIADYLHSKGLEV